DVPVSDHLAGAPDRADQAGAADDVVEAALQQLHQHRAGVPRLAGSIGQVAAELLFQDAVVVLDLLLLVEADAVVAQTPAAVAVHARGGLDPLVGGVLGDVGNGGADATGKTDLWTCVT